MIAPFQISKKRHSLTDAFFCRKCAGLFQFERDLLNLSSKLEAAFVLVSRIDGGDGIAADLERFQPVAEERAFDRAFTGRGGPD